MTFSFNSYSQNLLPQLGVIKNLRHPVYSLFIAFINRKVLLFFIFSYLRLLDPT